MSAKLLLETFERLAESPDAIGSFRQLVLDLAVSGRLVVQDSQDEAAGQLLERIYADASAGAGDRRKGRTGSAIDVPIDSLPLTVPDSWVWAHLTDICEVSYGFAFESSGFRAPGVGMPLIRIRDISSVDTQAYFEGSFDARYVVRPGDLLVGMDGDFNVREWNGPEALLNQRVMRMAQWKGDLLSRWLAIPLQKILDHLHASTSQTTVKHLSAKQVKGIQIPIPPLAEQHRIVAKVEELMRLCDQLELAQGDRELQRDALRSGSLYRLTSTDDDMGSAADVRFFLDTSPRLITRPEHLPPIRKAILDLAVQGQVASHDSAKWTFTTLGDIGTWGSGGTPRTGNPDFYGGTIPWVVIGDLNEGVVSHTAQTITESGLANSSAKLVEPGTVLIAMYGASVGKLGIAGFRCATNQAIAHCLPKSSLIERDYLFLLLRSLRASLVASAKGGAQPNISQTVLKRWSITLPPLGEQQLVVAKVEELMALCGDLEAALTSAQHERGRLLEALLHDAMSGSDPAEGDHS